MQLTDELTRLFTVVTRKLANDANRQMSHADFSLLVWLVNTHPEGSRISELAQARKFDISTTSRRCAALVDSGLVERLPDPDDGRASVLQPTQAGIEAVNAERSRRVQLLTGSLTGWSEDDKAELARSLARLNDSLENSL